MTFSALNVDFSSSSRESLRSTRPAHENVKKWYPLKRGYFSAIGLSSVKTVADKHRHAAYHNKHWWHVFSGINVADLEWFWTP